PGIAQAKPRLAQNLRTHEGGNGAAEVSKPFIRCIGHTVVAVGARAAKQVEQLPELGSRCHFAGDGRAQNRRQPVVEMHLNPACAYAQRARRRAASLAAVAKGEMAAFAALQSGTMAVITHNVSRNRARA